ncbi:hypothetical protein [Tsukamurella soli]|uniref:YbaB/EbfC DNA-binding family protein n=1 Tax=Tsukamurella soli TaxID=644556 RepID=A0ABP8JIW5_9ACTN
MDKLHTRLQVQQLRGLVGALDSFDGDSGVRVTMEREGDTVALLIVPEVVVDQLADALGAIAKLEAQLEHANAVIEQIPTLVEDAHNANPAHLYGALQRIAAPALRYLL